MEKDYYNQEAYNYIEEKLGKTKINDIFKPIIIDIMLRRRYEYQLEDKYFQRDVKSFIKNVKTICIESYEDEEEHTGGRFFEKEKKISLNANLFKDDMNTGDYGDVFSVFSHECYHAMNSNSKGKDRTFENNKGILSAGIVSTLVSNDGMLEISTELVSNDGMLEIFTEKESNRTMVNRKPEKAFTYRNWTWGYDYTTPYVNVIAAIFGVKEKDLLGGAIRGEAELYEVLNKNINDRVFTKIIFDSISLNINLMHIECYKPNSEGLKMENILNQHKFFYRSAEEALEHRVENLSINNFKNLQKQLDDIKLNQNAITSILENRFKHQKDRDYVKDLAKNDKEKVYAKITSIEEVLKSGREDSIELINGIMKSEDITEVLALMEENDIIIDKDIINEMPLFEMSKEKQEEWIKEYCLDGDRWNNKAMIDYIRTNKYEIQSATPRSKIGYKISEFISELLGRNRTEGKLLGEGKPEKKREEEKKSWDLSNWGMNKDDLKLPDLSKWKNNEISLNRDKSTNEINDER